ncbi:hypothetical protein ACFVFJ_44645 [Streptomyces sp. NPDC057717]|uniref:hypothetical protein n=1 Tax=Streptomyces sp. NPDC057717 TaxID=3346224 RepID=UPI0036A1DCC0
MTARLSPQGATGLAPVGYFCDHSDEPIGARTHHDWEWAEGEGYVFQHQPDTISSHSSVDQRYLKSEDRETRCPRAVPVYAGPVVDAELAAVRAELAKYVGKEPTIAEEMEHLGRCLNAVYDLCDKAEKQAGRWEHPLPVPAWVEQVRAAADGDRPDDLSDNRRRIYIDGKGNGWISVSLEDGDEYVVPVQPAAFVEQSIAEVAADTGGLREIGRCW